jgi:putative lipoprotein
VRNTRILVLAALLYTTQARADDDPWLGKDKALHFASSASLAVGGYGFGVVTQRDRPTSLLFGGGFAFGFGVAKETWDLMGHGDPSWKDLTWDAIGTVAGLATAWVLDVLVLRRTCAEPCR